MANEYKTIKCRLDGKQSVSIPVDIKQNGRYVTDPLDIIVRGFLKFDQTNITIFKEGNTLVDKTVLYPVLFTTDTIRITDGRCIVTIMPRSEDLFEETNVIVESASVSDNDIVSQRGISVDEQITDSNKQPTIIKIETGKIRTPYKLSIEITVVSVGDTNFYTRTVDRGTNPQLESPDAITSLFQKEKVRTPSNIIIECYNDLEWIPSVDNILGGNDATMAEILSALGDLENSTPFGMSPMYDGVVAAERILSDGTVNDDKKTIYVFTDNEANISKASLDNAIEEVNDIDGNKKVPVLVSNMAVVEPSTLSVKANSSDTKNINKLAFLTGGQALTIVDDSYLDDIVGIFYREAVGAMGYGTYEFIVDIGEEALINQMTGFFDIPTSDSNATWSIETSLDGYNYTAINDSYTHSETVEFANLYARYIKFKIILITAINSEYNPSIGFPDSPALLSIRILYNSYKVSYLYLNKVDADIQPYQITMAVDVNEVNDGQIEVGVAKSDAHVWQDFYTESQPVVDQNGKIVIPLRFSQDAAEFQQEPLAQIDTFTLKTKYGSFDVFANVIIYDDGDTIVPTNYYKLQPRDGLVIFNYALPSDYTDGDYKIGIINSDDYKVGIKMTNKTSDTALELYGVGYMYTTGKDLLPPLAKSSPEAQSVEIIGDVFDRFSVMTASYAYYDANFEPEDVSQRVIKWFINGSPISYLNNMTTWNNINDPTDPLYVNTSLTYPDNLSAGETLSSWGKKQTDSILTATDKVHFEIRVSDGLLASNNIKSNVVEIGAADPIVSQMKLMGYSAGNLTTRITGETNVVIYPSLDELFFADGGVNQSEIIWYVNDEIFKRGIYGTPVPSGQAPIHEIWPGDTGQIQTYALKISNIIFVQVIPRSGDQIGDTITSPNVLVENALPVVGLVDYVRTVHSEGNSIILAWKFFDFEINLGADIDETGQFDRTSVKWYRKNSGETIWPTDPVYIYNDIDRNWQETFNNVTNITTSLTPNAEGSKTSIVDGSVVKLGQQWYAEVLPNDSLEFGETVTTSIITITAAS